MTRQTHKAAGPLDWFFAQPHLLLILTTLFWGGNLTLGRAIAGHMPPVSTACLRWVGAFVLTLPFTLGALKRDWPVVKHSWPILLILAACGIGAFNTFAYIGLQYTEAVNGVLIQSFGPLMIAAFSFLIFGDRLTIGQAVGITISLTGVMTIIARGSFERLIGLALNPGDLWVLAAILCYSLYSTLLKKRPAISAASLAVLLFGLGGAMLVPFALYEHSGGRSMEITPFTLAALGYFMVFPSIAATFFFNRGVQLIGPNRAGPYFHLIPVFGSLFAILFLGERFAMYHAVGYTLILTGILIAQRWRPRAAA